MTTIASKTARAKRRQSIFGRLKDSALKRGPVTLFLISTIVSVGLAVLVQYMYVSRQNDYNDSLREQLLQKRQQNAIARLVQQTKPQFLQEFRRVINNFTTARELLPSEAEISNVLESIQLMAHSNSVRVTMFDASKPGAKSTNPAATQAPAPGSNPTPAQVTLNERVIPAQIQGSHANVVRFLNAIARFQRIIYVREFSITSLEREETVNLTLVTYDAPTSGILPPIPSELRDEFQSQGKTAQLTK
jgi:Tfp pilus assembly protein PilO